MKILKKNVRCYYVTISVFDIKGCSKFDCFHFLANFNVVLLQNVHLYGLLMGHFFQKWVYKWSIFLNFAYLEIV